MSTSPSTQGYRSVRRKACIACQRHKSRCDLLRESGCHRCRTLKIHCSNATTSSRSLSPQRKLTPTPSTTQNTVAETSSQSIQVARLPTPTSSASSIWRNATKEEAELCVIKGGADHTAYALGCDDKRVLVGPVEIGAVTDAFAQHAIAM